MNIDELGRFLAKLKTKASGGGGGGGGGTSQTLAKTLEKVTVLNTAIDDIKKTINASTTAFPSGEKDILNAIIGTTHEGRQMEVFKDRVKAALALSDEHRRLAAYFILLHRPDAVEIERMMRVGRINSYLGVVGLRLEMRYYDSMIAVADRPDGTFGIYQTPHSDINVFEPKHVYDPERKQGSVTFESRGGFLVTTDDALCPLIAVKGAHIPEGCGGYGAKPFDQRAYATDTRKDTFIKNQIKAGHSIFAALTSANSLVDGTFPTVLSVNGVFCASQFSQHLDTHAEFGINRQKAMWPGVTMLMYAVPELYTYRADRDDPKHRPRKMSLQELAAAARYNTAGATCSIRHATALAPYSAVAPARHVDGAMLPGWRERGMSLANVGSVPAGDLLGRVGLARSDLYLDPAMVSGAKRLRIGME